MNLAQLRKEYPEYADMSDGELSLAMHRKFAPERGYSEFRRDFLGRQGVNRRGLPSSFQGLEELPKRSDLPTKVAAGINLMGVIPQEVVKKQIVEPLEKLPDIAEGNASLDDLQGAMMALAPIGGLRFGKGPRAIPGERFKARVDELREKYPYRAPLEKPPAPVEQPAGTGEVQTVNLGEWLPKDLLERKAQKQKELAEKMERTQLSPIKKPSAAKAQEDLSLIGAIKREGGINAPDWWGDSEIGQMNRIFPGLFNKKTGKPLEELAEPLKGYFKGDATPDELYEMVEREIAAVRGGKPMSRVRSAAELESAEFAEREALENISQGGKAASVGEGKQSILSPKDIEWNKSSRGTIVSTLPSGERIEITPKAFGKPQSRLQGNGKVGEALFGKQFYESVPEAKAAILEEYNRQSPNLGKWRFEMEGKGKAASVGEKATLKPLSRGEFEISENLMSEPLKRLHNHRARTEGFQNVERDVSEGFLKAVEREVRISELPEKVKAAQYENLTKAREALDKKDYGWAQAFADMPLSEMHSLEKSRLSSSEITSRYNEYTQGLSKADLKKFDDEIPF